MHFSSRKPTGARARREFLATRDCRGSYPIRPAIGHFRGTPEILCAPWPSGFARRKCIYLDAFGILASAGNLLFLQAANASAGQMRFWDNYLVPISRVMDRAFAFSLGRSVLAIWRKTP